MLFTNKKNCSIRIGWLLDWEINLSTNFEPADTKYADPHVIIFPSRLIDVPDRNANASNARKAIHCQLIPDVKWQKHPDEPVLTRFAVARIMLATDVYNTGSDGGKALASGDQKQATRNSADRIRP